MPTYDGKISRAEPGRLGEQLEGKVWLMQNRAEWPVYLETSETGVLNWLKNNPEGVAWEYEITPVRQVRRVTQADYLAAAE